MTVTMDVSRSGGDVAFRTAFSGEYDLVQILRGLTSTPYANHPVDFRAAGLQRKGHPDIWHMDQVLAFSTDECSPMVINGEDIGGNHGHPCALRVFAPGHGKNVRDVGSLWTDESGLHFTLLRVDSADSLLLLSENIGPSVTAYHFADHVTGALRYVENGCHTEQICPQRQQGSVQLTSAIRHIRREAVCLKDGTWREIGGYEAGCERAEIREEYQIINPATVAEALRRQRPPQGYGEQPSLTVGEAMMRHCMTYRIEVDGTILCDFEHQLLQAVHMPLYLGIMHQEKCDVYGGGVWRYIPKLRPFVDQGRMLDFSRPYRTTADTMPRNRRLTPELWTEPLSPPDRQVDFIRRGDGTSAVAFASGFLPLYDGAPQRRAAQIGEAATLVASCKTYPTFAGSGANLRHPHRESTDGAVSFPHLRGVAYKKYFLPEGEGTSLYAIPYGADIYVYMDFFAEEPHCVRMAKPCTQSAELLESAAKWTVAPECVSAEGAAGYAVFRLTSTDGERMEHE